MAISKETVRKMKGYTLHTIKTDKYKTNTLVWKMKAPLEKDTVTLRPAPECSSKQHGAIEDDRKIKGVSR